MGAKENITIVKAGGRVLDTAESLNDLLSDFAAVKGKKILVHGGGIFITELCNRLDIRTKMVEGRRITSPENMDVVLMACAGKLNKNLVAGLNSRGMTAVGLCGGDLNIIDAVKRKPEPIDFGMVGDVVKINAEWLQTFVNNGVVPVLSSISQSDNFELLNTNADTIAASVASALSVDYEVTLYFYFDKPGVLTDANDNNSIISKLSKQEVQEMKAAKAIHTGMLPKLHNGFFAIDKGVDTVILGDNLAELKGTCLC